MAYFLDLFTPETWLDFRERGATTTGFRARQWRLASERVSEGDIFLCYLTRLSRWCGVLQVTSKVYYDNSPIQGDFTARFKVEPVVVLEPEASVPIQNDEVWNALTITNQHERGFRYWTGFFRSSLSEFEDSDGRFLVELLKRQQSNPESYPLTDKDKRQLALKGKIRTPNREVEVEVPDDEDDELDDGAPTPTHDKRRSIQYQAKVAEIGAKMGFQIWVPRNDKASVLELIPPAMRDRFLDQLPLNYEDMTQKTVERIDVLWLNRRSMARAFEIEQTTEIFSGLLRMADLLALQPNMDIRLHIVAPPERRQKFFREVRRPVFALLERGPLHNQCSFLSYDSIDRLAGTEHLSHMTDSIIGEYEEFEEV